MDSICFKVSIITPTIMIRELPKKQRELPTPNSIREFLGERHGSRGDRAGIDFQTVQSQRGFHSGGKTRGDLGKHLIEIPYILRKSFLNHPLNDGRQIGIHGFLEEILDQEGDILFTD